MKFLLATVSISCLTLLMTTTLNAQSFFGWADYPQNACGDRVNLSMTQTDYYGNPAVLVTAVLNEPAIVNVAAPQNGHMSNNNHWSYSGHSALVGYGEGIGYGITPRTDEITCYFYFADGSSCKNICIVEIDF